MANLHDNLKTNMAAIVNKAYCEMILTSEVIYLNDVLEATVVLLAKVTISNQRSN